MGAFNQVEVEETCPSCNKNIVRQVQFKYGDVQQLTYRLGDTLAWGGNDRGDPGHEEVMVDAYPEACPLCGHDPEVTYDVVIRRDVLVSATVAPPRESSRYDNGANYIGGSHQGLGRAAGITQGGGSTLK